MNLLLASNYNPASTDPTGWWISEKLDGVRAYWDGAQLVSRNGNPFPVPDWFTEDFPVFHLDGELWLDRGQLEKTAGIARSAEGDWPKLRFAVFDAPGRPDGFEDRQTFLCQWFQEHGPLTVALLNHCQCEGRAHLAKMLAVTEKAGGEGLMIRQPGSAYVRKRSRTLLKVKSKHDSEAVVVGYAPGYGRNRGRMGSLRVHNVDGKEFSVGVGFSDRERDMPPRIGSTIQYAYSGKTRRGVPRNVSFVRQVAATP